MKVLRTVDPAFRIFQPDYKGCAVIADATLHDNPISFATKRFYEFTGFSKDEVIGRNCRFLQGPKTSPHDVTLIRAAIKRGQPISLPLLNNTKDGTPFFNHLAIYPVRETFDSVRRITAYQNPITERMAHYQYLWDLSLDEALIADTMRGSLDLSDIASWLGVMNVDARAYLESILVKTGTTFCKDERVKTKVGTRRQRNLINELLETFEEAELLRSPARPNARPGELADDNFASSTLPLSRRSAFAGCFNPRLMAG